MFEFWQKYKWYIIGIFAPISGTIIYMIWQKIAKMRAAKKEAMKKKKTVIDETTNDADYVLKHFKLSEFDDSTAPGTGKNMQKSTLKMLDLARDKAGVPFKINSGFRTKAHNDSLKDSVPNSSHLVGYAADIAVSDTTRKVILKALYDQGFRRFGIGKGKNYIHVDNDPNKPQNTTFGYPKGSPAMYTLAQIAAF